MILVIPYCASDAGLTERNLAWAEELEPHIAANVLLSVEAGVAPAVNSRIETICKRLFSSVKVLVRRSGKNKVWPFPQNLAFQETVRHFMANYREPFFWWEADCTPLKAGWFKAIEKCHLEGGKAYSGHLVWGMAHINGVAVYPHNVADYSPLSMLAHKTAWDFLSSKDLNPKHVNAFNPILQHIWAGKDLVYVNDGDAPTFPNIAAVGELVNPGAFMFHRCKDGSLIHRLRDIKKAGSPERWGRPYFRHCYSSFEGRTEDEVRRYALAKRTWQSEYQTGLWVNRPVFDSELKRDSRKHGDTRPIPMLKDLIEAAASECRTDEVVVFTNRDTCLTTGMSDALRNTFKKLKATYAHRRDFRRLETMLNHSQVVKGDWYFGVDIFAFTRKFWDAHKKDLPDFIISYEAWDWVMFEWIKKHGGSETKDLIYHERHNSFWEQAENRYTHPCQKYNIRLAQAWFRANKIKMGSMEKITV